MTERYLVTDNRAKENSIYIDQNKRAYLFVDKDELENFLITAPQGLDYLDLSPGLHSIEDIVSLCHKKGASDLAIKSNHNKLREDGTYEEPELSDIEEDLGTTILKLDNKILPRHVHYNSNLNYYLYFYHISKDEKYLKKMKDSKFIIPCRVINKPSMVSIEYLTILSEKKDKNGKQLFAYVLFTDLVEYKFWMTKNKGCIKDIEGLRPLELSVKELIRINKNNGFFINPKSDSLYITGEKFDDLFKEKEEKA